CRDDLSLTISKSLTIALWSCLSVSCPRIAISDAARSSLKVALLLPSLSAGKCDWLVNRVADVTHRMNERRIANFLAQPPNKNLHQFRVVFVSVFPDAFA